MRIYQYSQIGQFHTNHNQDHLFYKELGEEKLIIAVMDGCSMGIESHFASCLLAKILKKISIEFEYEAFIHKREMNEASTLKSLLERLFSELKAIKHKLLLDKYELLSTIVLGVVNKSSRSGELLVVGDGLICCNGEIREFDQNNQPDYIGYHLEEDFESWFTDQSQRASYHSIEDLSITTDGIFTFRPFLERKMKDVEEGEILDYLLISQEGFENENMIKKKLLWIEEEWGLKPSDDISIIRIVL